MKDLEEYDFIPLEKSGLKELYEETKKSLTEQELQEIENEMVPDAPKEKRQTQC